MEMLKEALKKVLRFWPLLLVIASGAFMFGGVGFMVALSRLSMFGMIILVFYFVIKSLFPYINLEKFSNKAAEDPMASALVFCIMIVFIISLCYISVAQAAPAETAKKEHIEMNTDTILDKAVPLMPHFKNVMKQHWPDAPYSYYLPGLVEQETCDNYKKCWNPGTELKTKREYGFGLGQVTVAYKPSGQVRFNEFDEVKKKYKQLSAWKWEDRFNVDYQLTFIVLQSKRLYVSFAPYFKDDLNRWAAALIGYNSGPGSIPEHIAVCKRTDGCDPKLWFGHLEKIVLPYEKKMLYGRTLHQLRTSYPQNIILDRSNKYMIPWLNSKQKSLPADEAFAQ